MQPSPMFLSCGERSRAQAREMRRVLVISRLVPEHENSSSRISRAHLNTAIAELGQPPELCQDFFWTETGELPCQDF